MDTPMNYVRIENHHRIITEHGSFLADTRQKAQDMANEAARRSMVAKRVEKQRQDLLRQTDRRYL
jgi:hypothetical protein